MKKYKNSYAYFLGGTDFAGGDGSLPLRVSVTWQATIL